jgi:hypothetical protein
VEELTKLRSVGLPFPNDRISVIREELVPEPSEVYAELSPMPIVIKPLGQIL